ncbi:hypothetical protein J4444_04385 [Candidatus Woesearchaeota archaeon]|nr:hypothetical protein [Candidatus Woesearchaeota archaeon]
MDKLDIAVGLAVIASVAGLSVIDNQYHLKDSFITITTQSVVSNPDGEDFLYCRNLVNGAPESARDYIKNETVAPNSHKYCFEILDEHGRD